MSQVGNFAILGQCGAALLGLKRIQSCRFSISVPMSSSSNLDRGSFERILERASSAQQSSMSTHSFPAAAKLPTAITGGSTELERAMHAIARETRRLTNAGGAAIAVVKGDELVYCAGSGLAASFVGRRMMATFIVSSHGDVNREILRVENADTDQRIEGAICRQLGFQSLLILPVPQSAGLAGVLEISFNESHSFQDHELATYRRMAGLAGQAIKQAAQAEKRKAPEPLRRDRAVCPSCGAALKQHSPHSTAVVSLPGAVLSPSLKHSPFHMRWWKIADAAAVAVVLVFSSWIAYTYISAPSSGASAQQNFNPAVQAEALKTSGLALNQGEGNPLLPSNPMSPARRAARREWQRVRVGDDEIDYVSDDVTVRHFLQRRPKQERLGRYRVDYISDDVTVRHFTPNLDQPAR